jgi:hypothetical protein
MQQKRLANPLEALAPKGLNTLVTLTLAPALVTFRL